MATMETEVTSGWHPVPKKAEPLEVLADFESYEGYRIKVVSGSEMRTFTADVAKSWEDVQEDRNRRLPYFSTKVYVNKKLAAEYSYGDLPEAWLPYVDVKLQELAHGRADAEEVIGTIDNIIAELSEKRHRALDSAVWPDEGEIFDDFSRISTKYDEEVA